MILVLFQMRHSMLLQILTGYLLTTTTHGRDGYPPGGFGRGN